MVCEGPGWLCEGEEVKLNILKCEQNALFSLWFLNSRGFPNHSRLLCTVIVLNSEVRWGLSTLFLGDWSRIANPAGTCDMWLLGKSCWCLWWHNKLTFLCMFYVFFWCIWWIWFFLFAIISQSENGYLSTDRNNALALLDCNILKFKLPSSLLYKSY